MKMSQFWPKSKSIDLVFCPKMSEKSPKLKLIEFDCTLRSVENEPIWPKSKAIALVFCPKLSEK